MAFVVGIDENGMGPRLGPLVATAVTIEVSRYDARRLYQLGERLELGDSKQRAAFGHMAWAESVALALCELTTGGQLPSDVDALWEALGLDGVAVLRAPCPSSGASHQCWSRELLLPAFGGSSEQGRPALRRLQRHGVRIHRVRSAIACTGILNRERSGGRNKYFVNLDLFERLILDAQQAVGQPVTALCGLIGGLRRYSPHFKRLPRDVALSPGSDRTSVGYAIEGLGTVRFEVSADARHLPVGLASMVGKYVRELWMERQNRFYRSLDDALPTVSGYHDPVTRRFIQSTQTIRSELNVAQECFERNG